MSVKIKGKMVEFNMHTKENIIKQIFFDKNHNWGNFVKLHLKSIRKIVLEEVEKFRLCGEKEAGFSMYACECCGEIKIVPHCCKGRFCSVCATGYMQEWFKDMSVTIVILERWRTLSRKRKMALILNA